MTKKKSLFDLLNDLTYNKIPWEEQTQADQKEYSTYMVNRFLSMNKDFTELVNYIQEKNLSPRESYKVFMDILPKKKMFLKYISGKNKADKFHPELIAKLCSVNGWSEREAIQNLFILEKNVWFRESMEAFLKQFGKTDSEIEKILSFGNETVLPKKKTK